ncbi:hypothetical protein Sste5346_005879 [Sporothrix stenoceras]|uniref:Ribosomal protein S35, mitochondrial n=1 Tax=Sporothrix stenoceras TaxID=5173 RepID=A0ABR3Z4F2_9PEZI
MPPASTRAALAAVSAPAPSSAMAMASLSSSFGTLQIAGSRRATIASSSSSSSSFSPISSTSSFSTSSSQCCRRQASLLATLSASRRPLLTSSSSSTSSRTTLSAPSTAALFSTTPSVQNREKRRRMRKWLKERAVPMFWPEHPLAKGSDKMENARKKAQMFPMPNNDTFKSEPVLDESTRYLVYKRVVKDGESIKAVAASIGLDMRRVAAIVRLMAIERQWFEQGKPLAKNYNAAVLEMVPTFGRYQMQMGQSFENINEIHNHAYTKQQLFVPVPESRQFNREDAAKAFNGRMLSPDKRMPIPELIEVEKNVASGRLPFDESVRQLQAKAMEEQVAMYLKAQAEADAEEKRTTRAYNDRFEFRIKDYNAEDVGKHGRSPNVVGWRYGVPFNDRKRGQVKTLPPIR